MRKLWLVLCCFCCALRLPAESDVARLQHAVERSTLNQKGTPAFHLKAVVTPVLESTDQTRYSAEVEYWWIAPNQYRRELRSADFHQVEVRIGDKRWQKNDGAYLPFWLDSVARKLIEPVTPAELKAAEAGEVRHLFGSTYYEWTELSSDGKVQKGMGAALRVSDATGLLSLVDRGKPEFRDFGSRDVAMRITDGGHPEVQAKVTLLEILPEQDRALVSIPVDQPSAPLLQVVDVNEPDARKNLTALPTPAWPVLRDGPLDGVLTVRLHLDASGQPRECETPISDNPGVNEYARDYICNLRFRPYLVAEHPVQVDTRFTMPFHTVRPAGTEAFDSARNYFEKGRNLDFPATGTVPYAIHATFRARAVTGEMTEGKYDDTFQDATHWRREATFGKSRSVRSCDGDSCYRLDEGPQAGLTRVVLRMTEPIPAIDTFVESDWRISSADADGKHLIRVLTGAEDADGKLDPQHARAYWFDPDGNLVRAYFSGFEVRRSDFVTFAGKQVAQDVVLRQNGSAALVLRVNELQLNPTIAPGTFQIAGHPWKRQFTDEVR